YCLSLIKFTASPTVLIFSASSSAISRSNSSSSSITSSTTSKESASKSSRKEASIVICDSSTSNCSTIISFTLPNTSAMLLHLPHIILHNAVYYYLYYHYKTITYSTW